MSPGRRWQTCLVLRLLLGGFSGIAMAAAFEPVAAPALAPLSVAGLLLCLSGVSFRRSALIGGAFGIGFMGVLLSWLGPSIGDDAWGFLTVVEALWFVLTAVAVHAVRRLRCWPAWVAGVWTSVELVRQSWPLGGLPWGRVGHAVVDSPWQALLPYLGVTGTTFVVVLLGATLAWAGERLSLRRVAVLGGVALLGVVPSALPFDAAVSGAVTVAVVQGGVPGAGNEVAANARRVTSNHVEATLRLAGDIEARRMTRPDLVVWPENSTATDPFADAGVAAGIAAAASALGGIPVLVGAIVDAPRPENVLNQGIVFTDAGPASARYTKHHPVPFGEYIPFRGLLGSVSGRLAEVPRDMLRGAGSTPLDIGGVQVADAICFDVAHDDVVGPQVRNGAQMVVVQTSNATFIGTQQLDQQFAITRARALETGRSVVVASLNGISGVIRADGSVQHRLPGRGTQVLVSEVDLSTGTTPAVWAGRWPGRVVLLVTAVGMLVAVVGLAVSRRRDRGGPYPAVP